MADDRDEKLKAIRDELLSNDRLPLFGYRTENKYFPVAGEGSHFAEIMFIGEAPGQNEAKTGRPFCGAAGKILDESLSEIGIKREDVYITNIVKDRPPGNRDPLPLEIAAYADYLDRQINIIQPKVIATLGRFSMDYVMRRFGLEDRLGSISSIHGKVFEVVATYGSAVIVPLYHPAATIYDQAKRSVFKNDLRSLTKFISAA